MEYPFPGPNLPVYSSALFWAMHGTFIAMIILSVEIFFHGVRSGPKRWHVPICIMMIIATLFSADALADVEGDFLMTPFYASTVIVIALAGLANWVRWQRVYEKKPAWGVTVFICLVVTFFGIGLFLGEMADIRPSSEQNRCANRMREAALAMYNFHNRFNRLPDLTISDDGHPARSWRVEILPYLEGSQLRGQYHDDHHWDSPENLSVATTPFRDYSCPSNQYKTDRDGRYYTHVAAVTGPKTCFENGRGRSLTVGDRNRHTILLIEAVGQQIVWTEPRDVDIDKDPPGFNLPGSRRHTSPGWGSSYHKNGVNVAFTNGAVKALSHSTDKEVLRRLIVAKGGESNGGEHLDR